MLLPPILYIVINAPVKGNFPPLKPLHLKTELAWGTAGLLWTGGNLLAEHRLKTMNYNTWKIRSIDKIVPLKLNKTTVKISDAAAVATSLIALAWVAKQSQTMKWQKAYVMAENVWFTWNITQTSKMLFRRARPYTFRQGFVFTKKDDSYSFISGHSSITAAVATSMWLMNRESASINKNRGLLLAAGGLSLGTATLRISAGKHFTTDVLAGLLIGTGIAYLNTYLHAR